MFKLTDVIYKDILNIPECRIKGEQVTSLIGESGSGKTTTLKLLNHLISPDHGVIRYKDKDISELDPVELRREVTMLGQQPIMFDGDIKANLLAGFDFSERSDLPDDETLKKALERFRLKKSLDDKADKLSGGEKQRVAFARLTVMNTPVVLLDEPTSALDDQTENWVMEQFISVARERKTTVIMVTHSNDIAEQFSDEIINMKEINQKEGHHA